MKNIIIIGGSDAGISAALRVKELNLGITPTIIVADSFPIFSICGLPYYISRFETKYCRIGAGYIWYGNVRSINQTRGKI